MATDETKIAIGLTAAQLNVVLDALADRPYREAAPIIAAIVGQAAAQAEEPGAATKDAASQHDEQVAGTDLRS